MTLKEWLDKKNISMGDFAKRVGVHRSTISRLHNGIQNVPSQTLLRIIIETKGAVSANELLRVPQKYRNAA